MKPKHIRYAELILSGMLIDKANWIFDISNRQGSDWRYLARKKGYPVPKNNRGGHFTLQQCSKGGMRTKNSGKLLEHAKLGGKRRALLLKPRKETNGKPRE